MEDLEEKATHGVWLCKVTIKSLGVTQGETYQLCKKHNAALRGKGANFFWVEWQDAEVEPVHCEVCEGELDGQ